MSNFSQGDIVMIPFPFSDNPSESKIRTALIISNDEVSFDKVILAYITSSVKKQRFSIPIPLEAQNPPALITCEIRTNRLFSADKKIIIRKVCSLEKSILEQILTEIRSHF